MNGLSVGLISSVLGITCGIIAVITSALLEYNKNKNARMIRQSIIENHVDNEKAKLLVEPDKPKRKSKYVSLRMALLLIGMGLGYVCNLLFDIPADDIGFWIVLSTGVGVGLLVAFFIQMKLEKSEPTEAE